eukprot:COSAG01_NODE_49746_length_369_cov_1.018519_1_plen_41_part_01
MHREQRTVAPRQDQLAPPHLRSPHPKAPSPKPKNTMLLVGA